MWATSVTWAAQDTDHFWSDSIAWCELDALGIPLSPSHGISFTPWLSCQCVHHFTLGNQLGLTLDAWHLHVTRISVFAHKSLEGAVWLLSSTLRESQVKSRWEDYDCGEHHSLTTDNVMWFLYPLLLIWEENSQRKQCAECHLMKQCNNTAKAMANLFYSQWLPLKGFFLVVLNIKFP